MERIGEKLRKRREELGFTIDDIARSTNFRPELIRAVEGGRTAAFSADGYLNAFLRAYATKLDLDPREIILEQKSEEERIHDALSGMQIKSRKPVTIPRWLLLALMVAAVAVVCMPRLFGHAHVAVLDLPMTFIWLDVSNSNNANKKMKFGGKNASTSGLAYPTWA